jgi:hypothetical protein
MDDDGDLDLIVGNGGIYGGQNVVYLNDGAGGFDWLGSARNFGTGSDQTASVAVGDVDGNGDLDIVVGNSGQNVVYLRDESDSFVITRTFGMGATRSVAVGDVDSDGDLDLVVGNWYDQNAVCLNDGAGDFSSETARVFGTGSDQTKSVALGDLDGDGDLDLIAGNWNEQNVIYLNDGGGSFYTGIVNCAALPDNVRCFGTAMDKTTSVAIGDMDGDGDLDLVVGNAGQQNVVYLNVADGRFDWSVPARNFGTGSDWTESVAVGDLDGDGILDLTVGNGGGMAPWGQQNVLYLNRTWSSARLANNSPFIIAVRPGPSGNADGYSSPRILDSSTIPLTYTLFDPELDSGPGRRRPLAAGGGDYGYDHHQPGDRLLDPDRPLPGPERRRCGQRHPGL